MITLSPRRMWALILRYLYLLRGSWIRMVELAYWPTVQMILWGFISQYLAQHSDLFSQAAGLLLSGVLLWDILFRSQIGLSVVFFEEIHSRNLGQLFISPLQPIELILALISVSFLRTILGVGVAVLLAIPFYGFNLLSLGTPLIGFVLNLMLMGWSIGLMVAALVLRHGMGAEMIAFAAIFALSPVCGIYYPIETLPHWLQWLSWTLPASHVFEGMRTVIIDKAVPYGHLWAAILLNGAYVGVGVSMFLSAIHEAKVRGALLRSGE